MTRPRGRSERAGRGPSGRAGTRPAGPAGTGPKKGGCWLPATVIAAGLVLGVSLMLVPLGTRVWAGRSLVAWPAHDAFMVGLLVAAVVLYLGVSLLTTRLAVSPAGPRVWGARSGRPGPAPEPATVSALRGTAGSGATRHT